MEGPMARLAAECVARPSPREAEPVDFIASPSGVYSELHGIPK
jgi:hypothetical protein